LSVQLVFKISNLCGPDPPTLRTDGRTDRRTTCNPNTTALCTIVHRAVKIDHLSKYSVLCTYYCTFHDVFSDIWQICNIDTALLSFSADAKRLRIHFRSLRRDPSRPNPGINAWHRSISEGQLVRARPDRASGLVPVAAVEFLDLAMDVCLTGVIEACRSR